LSHTWCNNRDYGWRMQIRTLLAKGKSLAEIADTLNRKGVPPTGRTDGRPPWCARPMCPRSAGPRLTAARRFGDLLQAELFARVCRGFLVAPACAMVLRDGPKERRLHGLEISWGS
jgi:hypothetical protein